MKELLNKFTVERLTALIEDEDAHVTEQEQEVLAAVALAALTAPDDWQQRAEAAEALNNHLDLAVRKAEGVSESLRRRAEEAENKLLFTRPAPAADLSELVPDKMTADGFVSMHDCGVVEGWNDCCDAILRNIEEAAQ